jgi:thioesterase domain-containing protein/acyl carrier protein
MPTREKEKEYTPPRNDMEKKLLEIWKETLKQEKIGVTHNFFKVGGQSSNIIVLVYRVQSEFGVRISFGDVFKNPTVEKLSRLIRGVSANVEEKPGSLPGPQLECVVKLNQAANEKNIFILHPRAPWVFLYKELAGLLETDYHVYGIQPKGLLRDCKLPHTPEKMLEDYLGEIKQVQAQGPYIIGGYCIGSYLAYELVRMLEDRGDTVAHLIMFDAYAFIRGTRLKFLRAREYMSGSLKNAFKFSGNKPGKEQENSCDMGMTWVSSQVLEMRRARIEANIDEIMKKFKPRRIINTPVLVIKARQSQHPGFSLERWQKMTAGEVSVIEIPGDHNSIFVSPHVEKMAEIIRRMK